MSQSNKETNSINQIIMFSQFNMYINMIRILKKKTKNDFFFLRKKETSYIYVMY